VAFRGEYCSQGRAVDILYSASKYELSGCNLEALAANRWLVIAELVDKASQAHFIVANTHLVNGDSAGAIKTRTAQAKQVVAMLAKANPKGLPVIFTGDFNAADIKADTNPTPLIIAQAGYVSSDLVAAKRTNFEYMSFHGWSQTYTNCQRVDHIWLNQLVVADSFTVQVGPLKNEPSDHFAISAALTVYGTP
jgi:endonuclease/exonuclease/phosphatase family metal-dependent hydrolase